MNEAAFLVFVLLDPGKVILAAVAAWIAVKATSALEMRAFAFAIAAVVVAYATLQISTYIGINSDLAGLHVIGVLIWLAFLGWVFARRQKRINAIKSKLPQFTEEEIERQKQSKEPWLKEGS